MSGILFLTLVAIITNLTLGLLVMLRRQHQTYSRLFLIAVLSSSVWAVTNYAADVVGNTGQALLMVKLAYASSYLSLLAFLFFIVYLIDDMRSLLFRYRRPAGLLLAAISLIAFTPAMVSSVVLTSQGVIEMGGPAKLPFLLMITLVFFTTLVQLLSSMRRTRTAPHVRAQLQLMVVGLTISFALGFIFNALLPLLTNNYMTTKLGPITITFFSLSVAIAVVKYRLFDIRLAVTRALAYILALTVVAIAYVVLVFAAAANLFGDRITNLGLQVYYVATAIFIAVTFQPMLRFFNRLTRRIFYRDAYDTKNVLDQISSMLVSAVGVERVAQQTLSFLTQALKPEMGAVVVSSHDHTNPQGPRTIALGRHPGDLTAALEELEHRPQLLVIADEIDNSASPLYMALQEANVAVAARLKTSKERVGYLLFSYKVSGNMYSSQDIDLIRIVADELAVALQNSMRFEEISRFNETLQAEVRDATAQLRESNAKLQKLDRAKDEFMSMASHQLRTPLSSMKGYLSMALEGDEGELSSGQRRLVQEAYASTQRMVYLVGDFLNVSRLQTGHFTIEPSPTRLDTLVREEIEQLEPAAKARDLRLKSLVPHELPEVNIDESKVRQVVMNFIDNAIFYSKPGGVIEISLLKTAHGITFTVKDHGIGVPQKEQHLLFTKFFRATNARRARPDGTGVGLFIAKKVVVAHGGTIIFQSELRKGSTFGFRLPLKVLVGHEPTKKASM